MANRSYHVIANPDGGWNVVKAGSERATKHFETKKAAIEYAREVSKNRHSDLFIHKKDGMIQKKNIQQQEFEFTTPSEIIDIRSCH